MKFTDLLKHEEIKIDTPQVKKSSSEEKLIVEEAKEKPEEVLRGAHFKIKLVTPTAFGTQIDFAKQYSNEEIEEVLKDFKIKIKNKSVFIVD